jgi:hypothetical protein
VLAVPAAVNGQELVVRVSGGSAGVAYTLLPSTSTTGGGGGGPPQNTTIAVTTPVDHAGDLDTNGLCSLREAVAAVRGGAVPDCPAAPGSTTISLAPLGTATLTLQSPLNVSVQTAGTRVRIAGAGPAQTRVSVAGAALADRHIQLAGAAVLELEGLALVDATNGAVGGVGSLEVREVEFANNVGGGAIDVTGTLIVTAGSLFRDNSSATVSPVRANTVTIRNAEFRNNGGVDGGAVSTSLGGAITDTVFTANVASSTGGAVVTDGPLVITGGRFAANRAGGGGGAVNARLADAALTVTATRFEANQVSGSGGGGAILTRAGIQLQRSIFLFNEAGPGSADAGGALLVDSGAQATVERSTFLDNDAGVGGAIGAINGASVIVRGSHLQHNSARVRGGALAQADGRLDLVSTSIIENTTADLGGGISVGQAVVVASSVTIAHNEAARGGGVFLLGPGGDVQLKDSILAANAQTAPTLAGASLDEHECGAVAVGAGPVTLSGRAVFSPASGSCNVVLSAANVRVVDPGLLRRTAGPAEIAAAADGGVLAAALAPRPAPVILPGNEARGGDCQLIGGGVNVDQAGVTRTTDCTVGAVEQLTTPENFITVDAVDDQAGTSTCTLRNAVAAATTNLPVGSCSAGRADAVDRIVFRADLFVEAPRRAPLIALAGAALLLSGGGPILIDAIDGRLSQNGEPLPPLQINAPFANDDFVDAAFVVSTSVRLRGLLVTGGSFSAVQGRPAFPVVDVQGGSLVLEETTLEMGGDAPAVRVGSVPGSALTLLRSTLDASPPGGETVGAVGVLLEPAGLGVGARLYAVRSTATGTGGALLMGPRSLAVVEASTLSTGSRGVPVNNDDGLLTIGRSLLLGFSAAPTCVGGRAVAVGDTNLVTGTCGLGTSGEVQAFIVATSLTALGGRTPTIAVDGSTVLPNNGVLGELVACEAEEVDQRGAPTGVRCTPGAVEVAGVNDCGNRFVEPFERTQPATLASPSGVTTASTRALVAALTGEFDGDPAEDWLVLGGDRIFNIDAVAGGGTTSTEVAGPSEGMPEGATHLALGDLDGDTFNDVVVGTADGRVFALMASTQGVLGSAAEVVAAGSTIADLALARVTRTFANTERDDLLVARTSGALELRESISAPGEATFGTLQTVAISNVTRMRLVDLDGLGGLDVLVGSTTDGVFALRSQDTLDQLVLDGPLVDLAVGPGRVLALASTAAGRFVVGASPIDGELNLVAISCAPASSCGTVLDDVIALPAVVDVTAVGSRLVTLNVSGSANVVNLANPTRVVVPLLAPGLSGAQRPLSVAISGTAELGALVGVDVVRGALVDGFVVPAEECDPNDPFFDPSFGSCVEVGAQDQCLVQAPP